MKKFFFLFLLFLSFASAYGETVQIVPVERTVEPDAINLTIVFPENGDLEQNPVEVQMRLFGYPIGTDSSTFARYDEIYNYADGQSLHVIVDDQPYFPETGPSIDPFDEDGDIRTSTYRFKLSRLATGMHTIRAFPARSYGESLKGEGCFAVTSFFVNQKKYNRNLDLKGPYLTYNEPSNLVSFPEGKPVLLDFYLTNAELSKDGYNVKVTIDKKTHRHLTDWVPYYIYGLKRGKHTIRLQLFYGNNRKVPGTFNDVKRTFYIR